MTIRTSTAIKDLLTHGLLILFSLLILFPVLWTIRTSLAPEVIAYEIPPKWLFTPTLEHYKNIFQVNHFEVFFRNSLIIALGATLLSVPIAAFGGYAFARYRTGGRPLQFVVIGTQMLPGIVLILPIFVIFTRIHLTDSLLGVIFAYMAFNIPFLVWILMGFFEGIPVDIEEAAAIDGLSPLGTLLRIVIPISTPGVLSSAILSFILCWNEFLFALILTGSKTSTVPVSLAAMVTQRGVLIGKLSAGTAIAIIPMIIISIFVKKYLVQGLTLGAVK
ncbi:ABC transporter permease subunit [candidate division KSB3 bacterium]|uniref:ABC transporter permease subunit n=1 Tax=candidate division KSB3 bacterium TaxID=2044937 RepID=A0A9D5Q6P5_9BACT|nr:ABC transporter permease subunit [candidate division KSB3 bacterium]MBD3325126.1 ABC transporter permease subunit [candidate division KSB3 bacterium]